MPWHFQDTESAVLAAIHEFDSAIENQQIIIDARKELNLNNSGFEERLAVFVSRKPFIEIDTEIEMEFDIENKEESEPTAADIQIDN